MKKWMLLLLLPLQVCAQGKAIRSWIRINQLGYTPAGIKIAVWCSKDANRAGKWKLVNTANDQAVDSGYCAGFFGSYGPFRETGRIDFSGYKKAGHYYLQCGLARSPEFAIGDDVYQGAADFCLRYMRQQRSGFNPFLKDSCHTHDGYVLYGQAAGIPDSMHIDVVGGWHDASDYLQYSTTSANATFHLLAAYRDFPEVFNDTKQANGLDGKNGWPDVLDEARWGLDWMLKMHPKDDWLFNQVGDDRDHQGMRIPGEDSFYGRGFERPVYFVSGTPQQRGKFLNATTGTSSTAAKFSSAFSLGAKIFAGRDHEFGDLLSRKSISAMTFAEKIPGVTQTASVRSPYIYAEENWVDDMELAKCFFSGSSTEGKRALSQALGYAREEPVTPWLGSDTARHYEWYPFINLGHYELARLLKGKERDSVTGYYREGINRVWARARKNAFYRAIPYIWCSNNLTASFAIQCYWYRQLTGDNSFGELEQANFDWLFGCNPWGTSMVYGLPAWGDTPSDPHSAFTHLKNYPIDGGLVDGPVYGSIYNNLIGITLYQPDEYAEFQSSLAVYHDDYGDYSTNEPTMDGTASLVYLLASREAAARSHREHALSTGGKAVFSYSHGGIVRGDSTKKNIALVFTGHEFADGGDYISSILKGQKAKASFFFTGEFLNNNRWADLIDRLRKEGHFISNHSAHHLLYCDWGRRDSLLVTREQFDEDLLGSYERLGHLAEDPAHPQRPARPFNRFFMPPYEWYNDSIAAWTAANHIRLINYTPGTLSNADYTTPDMTNYRSSETIYHSIIQYEKSRPAGLNGFILLMHIGTDPKRTDKFYKKLPDLLRYLRGKGYHLLTVDQLLKSG